MPISPKIQENLPFILENFSSIFRNFKENLLFLGHDKLFMLFDY